MNRDEREAWIALATAEGVGDVTFARLLEVFGGPAAALATVLALPHDARADHLLARSLGQLPRDGLAAAVRSAAAEPGATERRMASLGGWLRTPYDDDYPVALRGLDPPPPVLMGLGDIRALGDPRAVAVVGTRRPTATGRSIAARVAHGLATVSVVVVSGLAIGIDGAAHAAAVDAGGRTVAVVGTGLRRPGPRAHRALARAILDTGGAIVSELPPEAHATRGTFPRRNRIISGLASATIVVEAPLRSGALITARHALEQGRGLFAAPGRPFEEAVAGCLALLRDTPARPLVGLDEMLVDLELTDGRDRAAPRRLGRRDALALLGDDERRVAARVAAGPVSLDGLARATGLPPAMVAAAVTVLQVRGWVQVNGALMLPAGPLLDAPPGARSVEAA